MHRHAHSVRKRTSLVSISRPSASLSPQLPDHGHGPQFVVLWHGYVQVDGLSTSRADVKFSVSCPSEASFLRNHTSPRQRSESDNPSRFRHHTLVPPWTNIGPAPPRFRTTLRHAPRRIHLLQCHASQRRNGQFGQHPLSQRARGGPRAGQTCTTVMFDLTPKSSSISGLEH